MEGPADRMGSSAAGRARGDRLGTLDASAPVNGKYRQRTLSSSHTCWSSIQRAEMGVAWYARNGIAHGMQDGREHAGDGDGHSRSMGMRDSDMLSGWLPMRRSGCASLRFARCGRGLSRPILRSRIGSARPTAPSPPQWHVRCSRGPCLVPPAQSKERSPLEDGFPLRFPAGRHASSYHPSRHSLTTIALSSAELHGRSQTASCPFGCPRSLQQQIVKIFSALQLTSMS